MLIENIEIVLHHMSNCTPNCNNDLRYTKNSFFIFGKKEKWFFLFVTICTESVARVINVMFSMLMQDKFG